MDIADKSDYIIGWGIGFVTGISVYQSILISRFTRKTRKKV